MIMTSASGALGALLLHTLANRAKARHSSGPGLHRVLRLVLFIAALILCAERRALKDTSKCFGRPYGKDLSPTQRQPTCPISWSMTSSVVYKLL